MARKRPARLAIIGVGSSARQHMEAVRDMESIEVAAVCDPVASSGEELPRWTYRFPSVELESLWADSSLDVVAVCTPPGTHVSLAIEALQSGKAVVIEKPVAISSQEFSYLLQKRDQARRPVAVMHQHRFILPDDVLMAPWSAMTTAALEIYKYRPLSYFNSAAWRTQRNLAGGGSFAHLGVHYADLACQILGLPIEVTGFVTCDFHPTIETRLTIAVRFEAGSIMSLVCDCLASARHERLSVRDGGLYFEVENGACRWSLGDGVERNVAEVPKPRLRGEVYREVIEALQAGQHILHLSDVGRSDGVMRIMQSVQKLASRDTDGCES